MQYIKNMVKNLHILLWFIELPALIIVIEYFVGHKEADYEVSESGDSGLLSGPKHL